MKIRALILTLALILGLSACTKAEIAAVLHVPQSEVSDQEQWNYSAIWNNMHQPQPDNGFLRFAQALHDDPFLACTRAHESDSAGGYSAVSPGGAYRGAYQFLQSTWNTTAAHAGQGWLVGADPATVPGFWQDVVAWDLYHWQGKAPWGGRC